VASISVDVDLDSHMAVFGANGVAVMRVDLAVASMDVVPLLELAGLPSAHGTFTGETRDVPNGYEWWGCPD
jgi:hypothetical protein